MWQLFIGRGYSKQYNINPVAIQSGIEAFQIKVLTSFPSFHLLFPISPLFRLHWPPCGARGSHWPSPSLQSSSDLQTVGTHLTCCLKKRIEYLKCLVIRTFIPQKEKCHFIQVLNQWKSPLWQNMINSISNPN